MNAVPLLSNTHAGLESPALHCHLVIAVLSSLQLRRLGWKATRSGFSSWRTSPSPPSTHGSGPLALCTTCWGCGELQELVWRMTGKL